MPEDYCKMQHHFDAIDVEHGCPHTLEAPSKVILNWSRWAHAKALNVGYFRGDSYKWLLDKEVNVRTLEMDKPSFMKRHPVDTPDGLFPQNWPEPEEPNEMRTEAQLLAALVMDDYDHRTSTDFVAPTSQCMKSLTLKHTFVKQDFGWNCQLEFDPFDHELPNQSDPGDSMPCVWKGMLK
eukprot:440245-Amphidinium_carterae.1